MVEPGLTSWQSVRSLTTLLAFRERTEATPMELETRNAIIPSQIIEIWQRVVDSVAALLCVPSVMINRLEPPELEIFRTNISSNNPFSSGTSVTVVQSDAIR
jgi:hypothetical protein